MASIEIKTVQNVLIRYQLGTFGERLIATMVDWFLIGISTGLFYSFCAFLNLTRGEGKPVVQIIAFSVFVFYSLVCEYFMKGSSPGKRLMGLRVLRLDGQPCEILDYVIRWAFRSVDIFLSVGTLVALLVGFTPTRQRVGEILSNTVMVKFFTRENSVEQLLKLKSISNYTLGFQASVLITESDAILIKEVLERSRKFPSDGHRQSVADLSVALCKRMNIPVQDVVNDHQFLLTVLKDYVALSR